MDILNANSFHFNPYAVPVLAVGILVLAIGGFIWKQNLKSEVNFSFFLLCLSIFVWLSGFTRIYSIADPVRAVWIYRTHTFLGVSCIAAGIYYFSVVWLEYSKSQKWIVWLGYAIPLSLYAAGIITGRVATSTVLQFWGLYPKYGDLGLLFFIVFFVFFMAAFANFGWRLYRPISRVTKSQIRLVIIAFCFAFTGSVDYAAKLTPYNIYPFGFLSVFVWISMIAYSVIKYRMLDIETVIHKTFLWIVTSVVFLVPIAVASYFAHHFLTNVPPVLFALIVFSYSVLFIPYVRIVQPAIDQLFQKRRWNLNQAVNQFTTDLVHLKNLEELAQHILSTIHRTLYPEDLQLLLWDEVQGSSLVFTKEGKALEVAQKHDQEFFRFLSGFDEVLLRDFVEIDPRLEEVRETARHFFQETNASVTVPIILEDRLIGTINLARKANLKDYSASEIKFLSDLRGSAAIAISNSLRLIAMQAQLRKWNEELEKQVNERTKELKEAQAHLIQAEKLATIGTLAGGVAHEINNPLTAILTNAQMLLSDTMNAETKESVEMIEEAAVRCREIVQKLMKYSRKSTQEETTQVIDLNEVIENTLSFLKYQLEQENIKITLDLKAKTHVRGNANEFAQVFTNLIVNAKDAVHQKEKGANVQIRSFETAKEVCAEIEDNGVGISPEIITKVFDPFFTTKDVGKGTGLGLSIVQGIVQKYDGKIDIKSKLGVGTKMSVVFQK